MLEAVTPRYKDYFCLHANETQQPLLESPLEREGSTAFNEKRRPAFKSD